MKTININNHVIKLYDSIDELPIVNFQKYNKYILIESGVGADIDAIGRHTTKIAELIKVDAKEKALIELQNLQQSMLFIMNDISPKYMAFTSFIVSIDEKPITDYSDTALLDILKLLQQHPHSLIDKIFEELKKKIDYELSLYFPDMFGQQTDTELVILISKRASLLLDSINSGANVEKQLAEIDRRILAKYRPHIFFGPKSIEIKLDKQFEVSCAIIGQKTGLNARNMSTLQYYTTISHINEIAKAEQKSLKHTTHGRR